MPQRPSLNRRKSPAAIVNFRDFSINIPRRRAYNRGMIYLLITLLILMNAFWLVMVAFSLPGTWLMLGTTLLFAWWQSDHHIFSHATLILMVVLAALGEVVEFIAGVAGARKAGGSSKAATGALVGGLLGTLVGTFIIPIPMIGSLLGAAGGAGLGAWLVEARSGKTPDQRLKVGMAAGTGRLLGTVAKLAIGTVIWVMITIAAFWP